LIGLIHCILTDGAPCGGNLIQPQRKFFSPNYPNNYPSNARCTWTLRAREREVVLLDFNIVALESCCDHVQVYDGPSAQYPLMCSVTGQNQRSSFISSSRYMTVIFSTDGSVTGQGFQAEWASKLLMGHNHCNPVSAGYQPTNIT
ncbi:deleted in malignant brain tumors 1 protein-like, partial [Clarias magur]